MSEVRTFHYTKYYNYKTPIFGSPEARQRWKCSITCGYEFGADGRIRDDRPIIFAWFATQNNQNICRVPLAIASLTEVNATATEQLLDMQLLREMSADEGAVQAKLLEKEYAERLYNPELAVYSVAAHCLANSVGIYNSFVAYVLASALSTLALNIPDDLISAMKIPDKHSGMDAKRIDALMRNHHRGMVYLFLCWHAPLWNIDTLPSDADITSWIEATLANAGLPNISNLMPLITRELDSMQPRVQGGLGQRLRELIAVGRHNLNVRGLWGMVKVDSSTLSNASGLKLCPLLLGDDTVLWLTPAPDGDSFNAGFGDWFLAAADYEGELEEFFEACRE